MSKWAVNFAHKSDLEIEDSVRANQIMVGNLRCAAVNEPHARPHTRMSPRLRQRHWHLERAKTAKEALDPQEKENASLGNKEKSTSTDVRELYTYHKQTLVLNRFIEKCSQQIRVFNQKSCFLFYISSKFSNWAKNEKNTP